MEPILKVRVVDVDHYGFNGRENHPTEDDKGLTLSVLKMENEGADETDEKGNGLGYTVFYCARPDGSPVEMVNHEVELVVVPWKD